MVYPTIDSDIVKQISDICQDYGNVTSQYDIYIPELDENMTIFLQFYNNAHHISCWFLVDDFINNSAYLFTNICDKIVHIKCGIYMHQTSIFDNNVYILENYSLVKNLERYCKYYMAAVKIFCKHHNIMELNFRPNLYGTDYAVMSSTFNVSDRPQPNSNYYLITL